MRRILSVVVAAAAAAVSLAVAPVLIGAPGLTAQAAASDDTELPVLTALSVSTSTATPGATVTVTASATDDVGLASITSYWYAPEASQGLIVIRDDTAPVDGVLRRSIETSMSDGRYVLGEVDLVDTSGNAVTYRADGSVLGQPGRPTSPRHSMDFAGTSFTVSGASDRTSPVLDSIELTTRADSVYALSTVTWSVADTGLPLRSLSLIYSNDLIVDGTDGVTLRRVPARGTAQFQLGNPGANRLERVQIEDAAGNLASYERSGLVKGTPSPTHHSLDLPRLDLPLRPATQQVAVVARPGGVRVLLDGPPLSNVVSGYRVSVQPAGIVRDVPVPKRTTIAADIKGLPNGVTQTVTVKALSPWGDSARVTRTVRPTLSSNVVGVPDVTRDGRADVAAMRQSGLDQDGSVLIYPGTGKGALKPSTVLLPGERVRCTYIGAGDVGRVGTGEPLCQTDGLAALTDAGTSTHLGSRGWASMRWVDGGYSLNADDIPDVLAMNARGELLLYPKTSTDRLLSPTRIGTGWQSMISVISAGDLNGDKRNDVAAVDAAGRLWLYPGNGKGGVTARKQIGAGWQNMAALLPLRDFDGDKRDDLGGITPAGDLRLYRGTGTGGVRGGVVIGTGWQRYL